MVAKPTFTSPLEVLWNSFVFCVSLYWEILVRNMPDGSVRLVYSTTTCFSTSADWVEDELSGDFVAVAISSAGFDMLAGSLSLLPLLPTLSGPVDICVGSTKTDVGPSRACPDTVASRLSGSLEMVAGTAVDVGGLGRADEGSSRIAPDEGSIITGSVDGSSSMGWDDGSIKMAFVDGSSGISACVEGKTSIGWVEGSIKMELMVGGPADSVGISRTGSDVGNTSIAEVVAASCGSIELGSVWLFKTFETS